LALCRNGARDTGARAGSVVGADRAGRAARPGRRRRGPALRRGAVLAGARAALARAGSAVRPRPPAASCSGSRQRAGPYVVVRRRTPGAIAAELDGLTVVGTHLSFAPHTAARQLRRL